MPDHHDPCDTELGGDLVEPDCCTSGAGVPRADLTPQRAADLIVTLGSHATYQSLMIKHGWTDEQYEAWLADSLRHFLLA